MTYFATRITRPDENEPLCISTLIARLEEIRQTQGDLWCYIYSADKHSTVPMADYCLSPSRTTLTFAAQIGTVCDEMYADLVEENKRLRLALDPSFSGELVVTNVDDGAAAGEP